MKKIQVFERQRAPSETFPIFYVELNQGTLRFSVYPVLFFHTFRMKGAKNMNKWKKIVAISAIAGLSWLLVQNPYTQEYLSLLSGHSVETSKQENELVLIIKSAAEKYEIKPQDARIDPIWKAVPGYNGVVVDVNASYQAMKETGKFNEKQLVFNQVTPKRHLTNFVPAPRYRAHPDKPVVSLLINVAWGNEYLQDMLAVLKKQHVKATFFLEGRWTKNNPELAKMIAEEGHEMAITPIHIRICRPYRPKLHGKNFEKRMKSLKRLLARK